MRTMPPKYKLVEEPADPLVDEYDPITPSQLIEALKFSRHMVQVVEADRRVFDEDLRDWREDSLRQQISLERRRDLVVDLLHDIGDPPGNIEPVKPFLSDIWIQYGRTVPDSLVFRDLPIRRVKEVLRRRILLSKRRLDKMTYGRIHIVWKQRRIHMKREDIIIIQKEKVDPGTNHFLTGVHNSWLQLVLRQTRDVVQSLGGHMTFFDHLQDAADKFSRIKEYLSDDASHFTRLLEDLQEHVRMQYKELMYLMTVFKEISWSANKAKRQYYEIMFDMRKTEAIRKAMLAEIEEALRQHQAVCDACMDRLLKVNTEIKYGKSAALGLDGEKRSCVKKYPHAILAAPNHRSRRGEGDQPTELSRAFEALKEVTLANSADELIATIRNQVGRAMELQSGISRLNYLSETVLEPEEDLFAKERERCRVEITARQKAIEKSYREIQTSYEKKSNIARLIIKEQRQNVDDFINFHDVLHSLNVRMGKNFGTYEDDMRLLDEIGGIEGLLQVTEVNMERIADPCGPLWPFFEREWDILKDVVDDSDFLEFRAQKLPSTNNRILFDSTAAPPRADEIPTGHLLNPRFITRSQIMEANWRIQERARLAELVRLKEAADEDERERQRAAKREQDGNRDHHKK